MSIYKFNGTLVSYECVNVFHSYSIRRNQCIVLAWQEDCFLLIRTFLRGWEHTIRGLIYGEQVRCLSIFIFDNLFQIMFF